MNDTTSWVVGIIVVILVGLGIWWLSASYVPSSAPSATTTATSTTSTGSNGIPVTVEVRSNSTVAQIVASIGDGSQFNSLLANSGVSLSGTGPYTVFVPTNESFASLPTGTITGMTTAEKKRLVQYHVVSGKMLDIDAVSSGNVQALSKDALNFNVDLQNKIVSVGGAYALNEYKGSNGVVYTITAVLLPPHTTQP